MTSVMLHFDSFHGEYPISPYTNCSWDLVMPLRNVTSIGIVSLELINSFSNVRAENQTNTLSVLNGNNTYSITLTPKVYTDINSLITDINSAYVASNHPNIVFSVTSYGRVEIAITDFSFVPSISYETNMPYILGFRRGLDQITGKNNILEADTSWNLGYDTIIYMNLSDPPSNNNANNLVGSFKVLMSVATGSIQYQAQISINQVVKTNSSQTISKIRISLVDRFGSPLPKQNSQDYSFTLSFNMD